MCLLSKIVLFFCFFHLFICLGATPLPSTPMQQALFLFLFFLLFLIPPHLPPTLCCFRPKSSVTAHYCFFFSSFAPPSPNFPEEPLPMWLFHGFSIERVITALVCFSFFLFVLFSEPWFLFFFLFSFTDSIWFFCEKKKKKVTTKSFCCWSSFCRCFGVFFLSFAPPNY